MSVTPDSTMSFTVVNKLTAAQLNDLCHKYGVGQQHSKSAKVNLLCLKLGISTSGSATSTFQPRETESGLNTQQINEFSLLTPAFVEGLQGWQKDLNTCPEIDDATVKRNCQACGHMGALLFVLAEIISSGEAALPSDATGTDLPCEWSKPKGAAVDPKILSDIKVRKAEQSTIRRTPEDYGKRYMGSKPPPTPQDLKKLRYDLLFASSNIGKEIPGVHALHPSRFNVHNEAQQLTHTLQEIVSELDCSVLPCSSLQVSSSAGPPIALLPHLRDPVHNIQDYFVRERLTSELTLSEKECSLIEEMTRGQSANLVWYEQRRGSVTSSTAHKIMKVMKGESKADKGRLVRDCLGDRYAHLPKPPRANKPSLKWGLANEDRARQQYLRLQGSLDHSDLRIDVPGLVVSPEAAYLRVSPDGIVHCGCHPSKLLEIKCPYASRDLPVSEAIKQKKIKYIAEDNDVYTLLNTNEGYYTQVQMAMAVLGLTKCDFLVWTLKSLLVVSVAFDQAYWDSLQPLLKSFFRDQILPAINSKTHTVNIETEASSDEDCITALMSLEKQVHAEDECNSVLADRSDPEAEMESLQQTSEVSTQPTKSTLYKPTPSHPTEQPPHTVLGHQQPICSSPCLSRPKPMSFQQSQVVQHTPLNLQPPVSSILCSPNPVTPKKAKENCQPLPKSRKRSTFCPPTAVTRCTNKKCRKILPESDFVAGDNSNASVQCECTCRCDKWYCWPCGNMSEEMKDDIWVCDNCTMLCL